MSTGNERAGILFVLMSPRGMLILTLCSYFYIWDTTFFESQGASDDFLVLGVATLFFVLRLCAIQIPQFSMPYAFANPLLKAVIFVYGLLTIFLGTVTGWSFSALIDGRFAIPGYGVIFSFYFVGAILGFSAIFSNPLGFLSKLFFLLFLYVGFIAGGKGFFIPAVFAYSFAVLVGLLKPNKKILFYVILVAVISIVTVVYSLLQDFGLAVAAIFARLVLQADSLSWAASMTTRDFQTFPISVFSFLFDLIGRFFGVRINDLSVGAEIARVVSGDDSGGGPNPNLPVLVYAVNQANVVGAFIMMVIIMLILFRLLAWARLNAFKSGRNSIFFSLIIFLAPLSVIDLVLYLQQVFCLFFYAVISSLFKNSRNK